MATDTKLMAREDPTSGRLTDIRRYTYTQYNGRTDLVDLDAMPAFGTGPWVYDAPTRSAVPASSQLTLSAGTLTVDPDGVGTVSVQIQSRAALAGKVVDLVSPTNVYLPIAAFSWVLDGSGNADVVFNQGTMLRCKDPVKLQFNLRDGSSPASVELELTLD